MRLYLMRHGIATERVPGEDDAARPLTAVGMKKTYAAAEGFVCLDEELDLVATSPLLRARQTAEIVRKAWAEEKTPLPLQVWPELEHAEYASIVARLRQSGEDALMLVGHEPGFSRLVAHLVTGSPTGFDMEFKKAGLCALDVEFRGQEARATLLWHLSPRQLRLMHE